MAGTEPPMQPTDWNELWSIFSQAFRSNPRVFGNYKTNKIGEGFEPTPVEDMLGSSPVLDLVRQYLPANVGSTGVAGRLPENTPGWVQNVPLGGYSQEHYDLLDAYRGENPDVKANTVRRGVTPSPQDVLQDVPIGDSFRRRAAQTAGVVAADTVGVQGLQNLWWYLNAAQAVASLGTLQAVHRAGDEFTKYQEPLLKRRSMRMAAQAPAWIGMSAGIGTFGREAGFTAAVPSEADPTVTANPLAEGLSRFFLGRGGQMLPYGEFVQERPDVTRGEYESYKAYLHGNKSPIKGTLDGINGPEVSFLGKSMPVATAVLPAVAGILGARYGARKAAKRLANDSSGNLLDQRHEAYKMYRKEGGDGAGEVRASDLGTTRATPSTAELEARKELVDSAYREYNRVNDLVENETLKQVLLYGGGSLTAAALVGSTLEQVRRALKGKAPEEPDPLTAAQPSLPVA